MDLNWVKSIVDTKGRPCPMRLADPCPGDRKGCAFWLNVVLQSATGGVEVVEGCGMMWPMVQLNELTVETRHTQAGLDKTATLFAKASVAVFRRANEMAHEIAAGKVAALPAGRSDDDAG